MQTRQTPVTFYIRLALYTLVALCLRVVALAPLVFWLAPADVLPTGSPLRWLALLCPLFWLLVVLPLRFSFAEALVQKPRQRWFSFDTALNLRYYGEKLTESLLHALNVLKWGLPTFALLGGCYYCYKTIDTFSLLRQIGDIGKGATGAWNAVANFFIGVFGGETLTYVGGLAEGLVVVGAVFALTLLVWAYGAVRNSATRYIWVLATRNERPPRAEVRRRLRGRRWRQFLTGLVNLALWSPFLAVVAMSLKGVVGDLSGKLMMLLSQSGANDMDVLSVAAPILFAFFCLYLPLLPARRWITASFATRDARHFAARPESAPARESKPAPQPAAQDEATPPRDAAFEAAVADAAQLTNAADEAEPANRPAQDASGFPAKQ